MGLNTHRPDTSSQLPKQEVSGIVSEVMESAEKHSVYTHRLLKDTSAFEEDALTPSSRKFPVDELMDDPIASMQALSVDENRRCRLGKLLV